MIIIKPYITFPNIPFVQFWVFRFSFSKCITFVIVEIYAIDFE